MNLCKKHKFGTKIKVCVNPNNKVFLFVLFKPDIPLKAMLYLFGKCKKCVISVDYRTPPLYAMGKKRGVCRPVLW